MNRIQSDCHVTRLSQPLKMKFLVVLAIAVACANADVLKGEAAAAIVRESFDSSPGGESFNYGYETENKIKVQAEGALKNPTSEDAALEIRGSFGYTAPDGTFVETNYIANEDGFQAQGPHIPVAPAVPELIARALNYIATHPQAVEPTRKFYAN